MKYITVKGLCTNVNIWDGESLDPKCLTFLSWKPLMRFLRGNSRAETRTEQRRTVFYRRGSKQSRYWYDNGVS